MAERQVQPIYVKCFIYFIYLKFSGCGLSPDVPSTQEMTVVASELTTAGDFSLNVKYYVWSVGGYRK